MTQEVPWQHFGGTSKRKSRKRRSVYVRDNFTCRDCGAVFNDRTEPYQGEGIAGLTLGHIVPKCWGGSKAVTNLIAQCMPCNEELDDDIWLGRRYPNGRPT